MRSGRTIKIAILSALNLSLWISSVMGDSRADGVTIAADIRVVRGIGMIGADDAEATSLSSSFKTLNDFVNQL